MYLEHPNSIDKETNGHQDSKNENTDGETTLSKQEQIIDSTSHIGLR